MINSTITSGLLKGTHMRVNNKALYVDSKQRLRCEVKQGKRWITAKVPLNNLAKQTQHEVFQNAKRIRKH